MKGHIGTATTARVVDNTNLRSVLKAKSTLGLTFKKEDRRAELAPIRHLERFLKRERRKHATASVPRLVKKAGQQ
jgi:hypothetical protein